MLGELVHINCEQVRRVFQLRMQYRIWVRRGYVVDRDIAMQDVGEYQSGGTAACSRS